MVRRGEVKGSILLINPWIYDLAAYNFWCEPLGLLWIGAVLREAGYAVELLDCLVGAETRKGPDGTGRFLKTFLPKPLALIEVPRRYGRYGIPIEVFDRALSGLHTPDLALVTCGMTYWYPGAVEVIRRLKRQWPWMPVVLGGTYATLCSEHARQYSGADYIVQGEAEQHIVSIVEECLEEKERISPSAECSAEVLAASPGEAQSMDCLPLPAHDLRWGAAGLVSGVRGPPEYPRYIAIETARGCPYRCSYCASSALHPAFRRRSPEHVLAEISWYSSRHGISNFAFYDDALLLQPETHILPLLDRILAKGLSCRLHTTNGVHAAQIDERLAHMMRRAGFRTVRLGLETGDPHRQKETGGKITNESFVRAVQALKTAGFAAHEIGAYVLVGLPGQTLEEMVESIHFVHSCGIQARIAHYSPLPGTQDWHRVVEAEGTRIEEEPLLQNNTVFASVTKKYTWKEIEGLKDLAGTLNSRLR